MDIHINHESCIRCGKCAAVCPSGIMLQAEAKAEISLRHTEDCISCGHCVDVCPACSVQHSDFPAEKLHDIDYSQMPSPEQMMALLRSRRSNRALNKECVPSELLEQIVEAAHLAPTATNSQSVSFTVVADPEKLRAVADYTINVFSSLASLLLNPVVKFLLKPFWAEAYHYAPQFVELQEEHRAGKDPILRKATALILFHTPRGYRFGHEDANLAYQNASLMAQSLGVSQIYMGFVLTALREDRRKGLNKLLGIEGDIHAIMALGMPAFRYRRYAERKAASVTFL